MSTMYHTTPSIHCLKNPSNEARTDEPIKVRLLSAAMETQCIHQTSRCSAFSLRGSIERARIAPSSHMWQTDLNYPIVHCPLSIVGPFKFFFLLDNLSRSIIESIRASWILYQRRLVSNTNHDSAHSAIHRWKRFEYFRARTCRFSDSNTNY